MSVPCKPEKYILLLDGVFYTYQLDNIDLINAVKVVLTVFLTA